MLDPEKTLGIHLKMKFYVLQCIQVMCDGCKGVVPDATKNMLCQCRSSKVTIEEAVAPPF